MHICIKWFLFRIAWLSLVIAVDLDLAATQLVICLRFGIEEWLVSEKPSATALWHMADK